MYFFQLILPEAIKQPLANSFYGKTICQKRLQIYTLYRFSSMVKSATTKKRNKDATSHRQTVTHSADESEMQRQIG